MMIRVELSTPYWDYVVESRRLASGVVIDHHYVRPLDSVMVIPRLPEAHLVMVRQLRVPTGEFCLEFPGGGIRRGESPETAARRELAEETGYAAGSLRQLGCLHPCNGLSSETCTIFVADGLTAGTKRPDESEELETVLLTESELRHEFRSGAALDAVTVAAWFLLHGEACPLPHVQC
jgi:ADP-ribose pyrophosphatase